MWWTVFQWRKRNFQTKYLFAVINEIVESKEWWSLLVEGYRCLINNWNSIWLNEAIGSNLTEHEVKNTFSQYIQNYWRVEGFLLSALLCIRSFLKLFIHSEVYPCLEIFNGVTSPSTISVTRGRTGNRLDIFYFKLA